MQKIFKDPRTNRIKVQTENKEPSLTQQQFKDQTDINKIMAQYEKQGINYNNLPQSQGVYADLTIIPKDYQDRLHQVMQAEEAFMSLPAELRAQYNNSPQDLIDWLAKPENNDRAVELGLKVKKEAPVKAPQAPAPAPATEPPKAP